MGNTFDRNKPFNPITITKTDNGYKFNPKIKGLVDVSPNGKKIVTVRFSSPGYCSCGYDPILTIVDIENSSMIEKKLPDRCSWFSNFYRKRYYVRFEDNEHAVVKVSGSKIRRLVNLDTGDYARLDPHFSVKYNDSELKLVRYSVVVPKPSDPKETITEYRNSAQLFDENNRVIQTIKHSDSIKKAYIVTDHILTTSDNEARMTKVKLHGE